MLLLSFIYLDSKMLMPYTFLYVPCNFYFNLWLYCSKKKKFKDLKTLHYHYHYHYYYHYHYNYHYQPIRCTGRSFLIQKASKIILLSCSGLTYEIYDVKFIYNSFESMETRKTKDNLIATVYLLTTVLFTNGL